MAAYYRLNQPGQEEFASSYEVGRALGIPEHRLQKLTGRNEKLAGGIRSNISQRIDLGMRKVESHIYRNMEKFIPDL